MIFLSAFTTNIIVEDYKHKRRPGQFYEEYKYLLKSIHKHYPEATPVLFLFQGRIDKSELHLLHPNLQIIDWQDKFKPELGIDPNNLITLKAAINMYNDNIVMLDSDCLVVKRFDEYISDDVDVTVTTRGRLKAKGYRQDIVFSPAIYHHRRNKYVEKYIDYLFKRSCELANKTGDNWLNVQATVNEIFIESGIDLSVDFNGFPSHKGLIALDQVIIKAKVVPQYVLGYPIQEDKYYPETAIIHYKNYKHRKDPWEVFKQWA